MAGVCAMAEVQRYDRHCHGPDRAPRVGRGGGPTSGVGSGHPGTDRPPTVVRVSDTIPAQVSELFDPRRWREVEGFDFTDITYHRGVDRSGAPRDLPVVRIAIDRPEVRNAFRPHTVDELYRALDHARMSSDVAAVLLTGNGPSPKDGGWAFCSGGDQRIRGRDGYRYEGEQAGQVDPARAGR